MQTKNFVRIFTVAVVVTVVAIGMNLAASNAIAGGATDDATKALDGAKVYAASCGTCHAERWPNERTDREWKLIVMHMRVRANLTAAESDAVLIYLQSNNSDK